jgi:hypothetical protein
MVRRRVSAVSNHEGPAAATGPSSFETLAAQAPQDEERETARRVSSTRPYISFKGRFWKVPQAFARERLAIRPLDRDGHYGIFFASWQVASIDLTNRQPVSDVSGLNTSRAMTA